LTFARGGTFFFTKRTSRFFFAAIYKPHHAAAEAAVAVTLPANFLTPKYSSKMKKNVPFFLMLLTASAHFAGCEVAIDKLEPRDVVDSMDDHLRALLVGTWYYDNPDAGTPYMNLEKGGAMVIVEYSATGAAVEVTGTWRLADDIFTQVVNEEATNFALVKLTTKALAYEESGTNSAQHSFHKKY
jgi:hypothetical protein